VASEAFWRYCCRAKQAERAGLYDQARRLLCLAHRVAADEDLRLQLEDWSERLRPPPLKLATDDARARTRKTKGKKPCKEDVE